jgi:ElaB/YqjD/DUF883 family membrane-anchored ribosome-binding protein
MANKTDTAPTKPAPESAAPGIDDATPGTASFDGDTDTGAEGGTIHNGNFQAFKDSAIKLGQQAGDKAREYADQGKTHTTDALGEAARMMTEAANTVDERFGEQYGKYARQAADAIGGFSDQLKAKNVDDLIEEARGFVRKSPAIAIGTAAAVGFVLARLLRAGVDTDRNGKA